MRPKVTVVGAGNVGATAAQYIALKEMADVVLIDILEGIPQGKGLDMWESAPIVGSDSLVVGTNNYQDTAGSDVVVITAGLARKPGMSRDDLLIANARIVSEVTDKVAAASPKAIIIVVSNPLDAMTQLAFKRSGFPRERVFGMAGILDAARLRSFVALELNVSVESVYACVLGGHGDAMVPLPRYTTVGGIPITELMLAGKIEALVKRTREGGGEIVAFLKTGSAYYAPAAAVAEMVESVLKDKKKILPCCAYLNGEYGIKGLCVGVPVKVGQAGIEQILELKLTPEEAAALNRSAAGVKELVDKLEI
ncbi:MAG TPA: malate dehydrogenase [bacterium]|nr:malate dehydrogenase [bacterium]